MKIINSVPKIHGVKCTPEECWESFTGLKMLTFIAGNMLIMGKNDHLRYPMAKGYLNTL